MGDLESLKQKYAPVLQTLQDFTAEGAAVQEVNLAGEQLHIKATVPSTVVANRVWDAIKKVDPAYSDLKHEIATTGGETQAYTVKNGDNLSKISKHFYGSANHYQEIAKANKIADPDKIKVGQELQLPVLAA